MKKNIVAKAEEEKKIAELNIKNFQNQNTELSTQTSKYKNIGNALKDQLIVPLKVGSLITNEKGQQVLKMIQ